jgi:RNA polymerase sigma factor (sigma-70 family)
VGKLLAFPAQAPPADKGEDESALIARCRAGDREAMGALLARHAAQIERLIVSMVGSGPDAEDILQQSFIAAIGAFPRFRGEAKTSTWLSRIAVHVAIDFLRKPQRHVALDPAELESPQRTTPAPDDVAAAREEVTRLRTLLDQLTPVRRVAFVLHAIEGHSIEEVAALMGATRMATKSRIFWARRALLASARRDPWLRSRFGGER